MMARHFDQLLAATLAETKRARRLGLFTEPAARLLLHAFLEQIEVLARKHAVRLPIGTFRYVTHAPRRSRTVRGVWVEVPAQRKLKFTAARKFREVKS
jgi:nucleoid DNA-binding protein